MKAYSCAASGSLCASFATACTSLSPFASVVAASRGTDASASSGAERSVPSPAASPRGSTVASATEESSGEAPASPGTSPSADPGFDVPALHATEASAQAIVKRARVSLSVMREALQGHDSLLRWAGPMVSRQSWRRARAPTTGTLRLDATPYRKCAVLASRGGGEVEDIRERTSGEYSGRRAERATRARARLLRAARVGRRPGRARGRRRDGPDQSPRPRAARVVVRAHGPRRRHGRNRRAPVPGMVRGGRPDARRPVGVLDRIPLPRAR